MATKSGHTDDGSVAVTLSVAMTMLIVLIGAALATLTYLAQQMVLTHTVVVLADDAADTPGGCVDVSAAIHARLLDVAVWCDDTAYGQVVTVTRPTQNRAWPAHTVTVRTYRER